MGGDFGPQVTVPASLACLRKNPDLKLIMVGDEAVLHKLLEPALAEFSGRISIQHASQVVEMDENAAKSLEEQKRFFDAGGDQPGKGRQGRRLRQCR